MVNMWESLQQQYATITAEITNKILKTGQLSAGEEKSSLIGKIELLLEEAKETLEQLGLEIRSLPQTERKTHQKHLDAFDKELSKLRIDFKAAKVGKGAENEVDVRLDLFDGDSEDVDSKKQLLNDTQRLEASSRKLEAGYTLCVESEQVGAQILSNLSSQREVIGKSRDHLRTTNYDLSRGSRVAHLMIRRAMQHKVIVYGIVVILVLVFIFVIYRRMFQTI